MFEGQNILSEFGVEFATNLGDFDSQLRMLATADGDDQLRRSLLQKIHSIKTTAGFLGLITIHNLASSMETVLDRLCAENLAPTSDVVQGLLNATDALNGLIQDVARSDQADINEYVTVLNTIASRPIGDDTLTDALSQTPSELAASMGW